MPFPKDKVCEGNFRLSDLDYFCLSDRTGSKLLMLRICHYPDIPGFKNESLDVRVTIVNGFLMTVYAFCNLGFTETNPSSANLNCKATTCLRCNEKRSVSKVFVNATSHSHRWNTVVK